MTTLFKVTDGNGSGRHGGRFEYPLPKGKRAGAWTVGVKNPEVCRKGYHLTNRPEKWWTFGQPNRIFLAEGRGEMAIEKGDKVAFESVRLVKELSHDWDQLPIYPVVAALLCSEWRRANGPDAQWPAWATSILRGAYLSGADLRGADLRGAYLRGADLRGADLSGAYLSGADLRGADLRGADLRGAYLRGAYLRGAYLSGAYLSGAYLRGAYLRGAYLSGRLLTQADWQKELEIDPVTGFVSRKTRLPW